MAKVQLKSLSIVNFKGIKDLLIDFKNHITNIYGDNATGKTTVFDAFLWLFFGKNSDDVSVFEIKPLDINNNFIKDVESEVSAIIQVDQQEIAIKKVLRQKWVKRRGELDANYSGDENVYYWNDVPLKESEFKAKVKTIIDELVFKLITNPFYFNSLKWQDRRNTLIEIAGNIQNDDIIDSLITPSNKGQYAALINALNANKTTDEFKRELGAKKKKIKEEAESIPSRIDEVRRGMPTKVDFEAIKTQLGETKRELESVQATINDEVAMQAEENKRRAQILKDHNQKVQQHQQQIFALKTSLQNIEFEAKQAAKELTGKLDSEIRSIQRQISDKQLEVDNYTNKLQQLGNDIATNQTHLDNLRGEYEKADDEQLPAFDDNEFVCPSCKQALPFNDIEARKDEIQSNFNEKKRKKLDALIADANQTKKTIADIQARVANGNTIVEGLKSELSYLNSKLTELRQQAAQPAQSVEDVVRNILDRNPEYSKLHSDLIESQETAIDTPVFEDHELSSALNDRRSKLNDQVFELQNQLIAEEQIKKADARIAELEKQESTLAQELASLEGIEYAVMQFTKAKIDMLERRINGKFSSVRFKMFNVQKNGGEEECCETLVNSNGSFVPFSDANNAAKINAGIDIINTLCKHYGVTAPIYIDNRESVTRLIDTDSQIVNLIVSEPDKRLRVA